MKQILHVDTVWIPHVHWKNCETKYKISVQDSCIFRGWLHENWLPGRRMQRIGQLIKILPGRACLVSSVTCHMGAVHWHGGIRCRKTVDVISTQWTFRSCDNQHEIQHKSSKSNTLKQQVAMFDLSANEVQMIGVVNAFWHHASCVVISFLLSTPTVSAGFMWWLSTGAALEKSNAQFPINFGSLSLRKPWRFHQPRLRQNESAMRTWFERFSCMFTRTVLLLICKNPPLLNWARMILLFRTSSSVN